MFLSFFLFVGAKLRLISHNIIHYICVIIGIFAQTQIHGDYAYIRTKDCAQNDNFVQPYDLSGVSAAPA